MIALAATLIPLVVLAGAAAMSMLGPSRGIATAHQREMALQAAESGLDVAVFEAKAGNLVCDKLIRSSVSEGGSFVIRAENLKCDGRDNDNDTQVDEADEDIFEITVLGRFGKEKRKIRAFLDVRVPSIPAAVTVQHPNIQLNLTATPHAISGNDTNIDGTTGPSSSITGLAITAPSAVTVLDTELQNRGGGTLVIGKGNAPSIKAVAADQLGPKLMAKATTSRDVTLNNDYTNYAVGNAQTNDYKIQYCAGSLSIRGTSRGAGVLVVAGDLVCRDDFRFDGVVMVQGKVDFRGNAHICGALIHAGDQLRIEDNARVDRSTEAITAALSAAGITTTGKPYAWRELSSN